MSNRPYWNRSQNKGQLLQYVHTGTAAAVLHGLPLRAHGRGDGPSARVQQWFDAFARLGIRYADESLTSRDGWQEIRSPAEVLASPRLANCVDLAVTFAGACLDAGVHPLIVLLESVTGDRAHAVVAVWLEDLWPGVGGHRRYRDAGPQLDDGTITWPPGLRRSLDGPGGFLPIDVALLARDHGDTADVTLAAAVSSADVLLNSPDWRVDHVLDVGRDYDRRGELADLPPPTGITTHAEEVAGLHGLRKNLLESNLRFVPPSDPAAPTRPERLLESVADAAATGRGLLLVGAAGVGKTRTCFEVGHLALEQGWAVLHVAAGEPLVTTQQVYEAVQEARCDRVLVVFDYLNECPGIDFQALRHRYLPDATRAGITMALLASCRAGWYSNPDRPVELVFNAVPLQADVAQEAATRDAILEALAPKAIDALGMPRLQQLCGLRPVIAMLVAAEAESLAQDGILTGALTGVRPEDLMSWLRRRLDEDQLVPPRAANPFSDESDDPSIKLQACLAMLAAMPQDRNAVLACGDAVESLPEGQSEILLDRLRSMGWVVDVVDGLGPVHDLVTDQLAERMLLSVDRGGVRPAVVNRVLSACLTRGRTVGRFGTNLGRVARDLTPESAAPLITRTTEWLTEHAGVVGDQLALTEDEGAYALGAVIDSVALRAAAFESWEAIVGPWLARHSQSLTARHLLYKGLRAADANTATQLTTEALTWLDRHVRSLEASFVLDALLGRDLDVGTAETVTRYALTWLDQYGTTPNAEFVLGRLLSQRLTDENRELVDARAMAWIEENGVGSDLVSKFVVRQRLITERLAELLLIWAAENPRHEDVAWRLGGVARKINDWPHLVPLLLTVIEGAVPVSSDESPALNLHGEFDSFMNQLCKATILRAGIGGARLDDVLRRWVMRPEAFHSSSHGSHYCALVSRVTSLFMMEGAGFAAREETFNRLQAWIERWDCAEDDRAEAFACLELHRRYHRERGPRDTAEADWSTKQ